MNKTITIIAVALALVSCNKNNELVTARFGYSYYEQGSLTRAVTDNTPQIKQMIRSTLPKVFPLAVQSNKTQTVFDCSMGQSITIPIGTYTVSGRNEAGESRKLTTSASVSSTPQLSVMENVDVVSGKTDYSVSARYECFAIVVNYDEVEKVTCQSEAVSEYEIPFLRSENYGIIYVKGMGGSDSFSICVYPKDKEFNDRKCFSFAKTFEGDVFCEEGAYYIVHPFAVETSDMSIAINFPDMNGKDLK